LRATCPLAFADLPAAQLWQAGALAQAGQGLARLLESYGEQAGGSAAIPLDKFQNPNKFLQNAKIVVVIRIQNSVASKGIF